ncbi:MAG: helix-hairpin-helix domain-containing protein [Candidatus Aureabacteria bacterium]|nr:helix-hairpin-helix domain-containing protein [Candidatus Auribacterota bacterium]
MKRMRFRCSITTLCFIVVAALASSISTAHAEKAPLTVTFLNVGQGDSTVITTPSGKTALIDGGPNDKGKSVILPFLKSKGISRLDTMIMTHPDADHISGLVYLLQHARAGGEYLLNIKECLDPGKPHPTSMYQELLKAVKRRPETKYRMVRKGDQLNWGEGVTAEVVSPDHLYEDTNNCSVVVKLTYGKISFLFTGDAAFEAEKDMVKNYGNTLKSTVLKTGHHGSAYSSSEDFLTRIKPEVVILSVGERNKYGLPSKEAMARLSVGGPKIYRTDYQGTITITTDGETYKVITEREAPPIDKRWDHEKAVKEEDKVNLNTASFDELMDIPHVGRDKAEAIIAHRPFLSVDDLRRIRGIGDKTFEHVKPLVTVSSPTRTMAATPGTTPLNKIKKEDIGKKAVTVTGTIKAFKVFREEKGRTLMITDPSGAIDILIWENLYKSIPEREKLVKGTMIKVRGEVESYKNRLQIKPIMPADIQIVKPAPDAAKKE